MTAPVAVFGAAASLRPPGPEGATIRTRGADAWHTRHRPGEAQLPARPDAAVRALATVRGVL